MCQDVLINVIFGCEIELWRLRFGTENGIDFWPWLCQDQGSVSGNETLTSNMLFSKIVTVSQIKFTLKCLLNSLHHFIGLLVIRNG